LHCQRRMQRATIYLPKSSKVLPNMSSSDEKRNIVVIGTICHLALNDKLRCSHDLGGGIIGSTTAYFLTRHPKYDPVKHTITLLEATKIAGGASGKAGGLLGLWGILTILNRGNSNRLIFI
jgi:hypothetical protein